MAFCSVPSQLHGHGMKGQSIILKIYKDFYVVTFLSNHSTPRLPAGSGTKPGPMESTDSFVGRVMASEPGSETVTALIGAAGAEIRAASS